MQMQFMGQRTPEELAKAAREREKAEAFRRRVERVVMFGCPFLVGVAVGMVL